MKIACFTGHRPDKFSFRYDESQPECQKIKQLLFNEIYFALHTGYDYFIAGGALGVDTWAAEIVLALRNEYQDIQLEIAVPCKGQEKRWPPYSQRRYSRILSAANKVHFVSKETYKPFLMLERNKYMVNNSSLLIAVFDGSPGGTKRTYDYAIKRGISITRIDPNSYLVERNLE